MELPTLSRLFTPHKGSDRIALVVGMVALLSLGLLDYQIGEDFRFHALFIFPLGFIAIHCARAGMVVFATAVTVALQTFILFSYPLSLQTKAVSSLVSLAAVVFTVVLARLGRKVHVSVADEATRDPLTGLHNRRSFEAFLGAEIARQKRYGTRFSLLMIDLDHFKQLNDTRGHGAGDECLRLAAEILDHSTRDSDVVGRLGGDEFAVLMPNIKLADCRLICANVVESIARGMSAAGFPVTTTIGSRTFDIAPRDSSNALEAVDLALYRAKAQGRNRAVSL